MSDNSQLRELHMERLARSNAVVEQKESETKDQEEVPFECPVCYTNGLEFGFASPTCGHILCLFCYSNILIRGGDDSKCPCCRKPYFKPAVNAEEEELDPYYGLPPLVPAPELSALEYVLLTRLQNNNINNNAIDLLNIITDMSNIANRLDDLIEPVEAPVMQEMS